MQNKRSLLRIVNMEYALIQGLYWIGFCGIVSYAAVYLQARGYSNTQLGRILAAGSVISTTALPAGQAPLLLRRSPFCSLIAVFGAVLCHVFSKEALNKSLRTP